MELFAFWRYDSFPFILGDVVTKLHSKGVVDVAKYPGFSFQSFRLTNLDEGKQLYNQLETLKEEYYAELLALNNKYKSKVKSLGFNEIEVPSLISN